MEPVRISGFVVDDLVFRASPLFLGRIDYFLIFLISRNDCANRKCIGLMLMAVGVHQPLYTAQRSWRARLILAIGKPFIDLTQLSLRFSVFQFMGNTPAHIDI